VPARGVLALLDCALEVCAAQLQAAHYHELAGASRDSPSQGSAESGAELRAARAILYLARDLRTLLHVYEREVDAVYGPPASPWDDDPQNQDIPF
jgi:hypothetical protein